MSAQDYYGGQGQGHQQYNQQGYGNSRGPYNQGQNYDQSSNQADPYEYLSRNQQPQSDYNRGHSPAPYQQSFQQYGAQDNYNIPPHGESLQHQSQYQSDPQYQSQGYHEYSSPPAHQGYQTQPSSDYDQSRQYQDPNQGFQPQGPSPIPTQPGEGDRGLLGALGGAYAGHKLEDAMKKKKKDKKHHDGHSRRSSSSSSSSSSSDDDKKHTKKFGAAHTAALAGAAGAAGTGGKHLVDQRHNLPVISQYRGNFSSSATEISFDRHHDLIARCATVDGARKLSAIDLNAHLSNEWGQFRWVSSGGGFGDSARNIRLVDGGRVLEAELNDGRGGWRGARVVLDERITNENGDLRYLD